ncbi:MAG: lipopolysaccharide kinase InaA family protein [Planctomycetota bacterium]
MSSSPDPIYENADRWPTGDVLKDDRRSRVWRAVSPQDDPVVVKRCQDHSLKQAVLWTLGRHPFQQEQRNAERLRSADLPAVEVLSLFARPAPPAGLGKHAYLVTPAHPRSAYHHLRHDDPTQTHRLRRQLTRDLGALTARLLQQGLDHRDYKLTNILLSQESPPNLVLIDLAPIRPLKPQHPHRVTLRMCVNLLRSATQGAERNPSPGLAKVRAVDRMRFFRAFAQELTRDGKAPGALDLKRLLRCPDFAD